MSDIVRLSILFREDAELKEMMKKYYFISCIVCIFSINLIFGINNVDRLEEKLKTVSGRERIDVLNELAEKYLSISPEKTIEYGRIALQLSQKSDYSKGAAESYFSIGIGNNGSGNFEKALKYLNESLKKSEEARDKKGMADSLHNIGNSYYFLGNYDKALEYHLNALKIREEIGDKKGIADSLSNAGLIYYYFGNYDKALEYYLNALKIREESGDKKSIFGSLNNIGEIYANLANNNKALEYHLRSLKIKEELGDKKGISSSLNNIGNIYSDLGNYDKALRYYLKALKIKEEIGYKKGVSVSLNNIGNIYSDLENYDEALKYYLKSLKIEEEIGDKRGIAISFINIGQVHKNFKNYDRARYYLEKGLKTSKEIGAKKLMTFCYEYLSDIDAAKSNFKKALEYHQLYVEVKDSIFSKESNDKIAEMQVKYETEKKKKEIEILKRDKEIQNLEISRQKDLRNALIVVSGLILVLVILIYSRYRSKQKSNKILSEKNRTITGQRDQLTQILEELCETQKILVDTAHRAGISEMANGTLHNIGNVLNSVKVSAQVLKEKSEGSEINDLHRVIRLIENHADDPTNFLTLDEKGSMIPAYLSKLGKVLEKEQNAFMEELSHLDISVNHIEEILTVQQNYAGISGIVEFIALSNILDDVLRMYGDTFRRYHIKLVKQYKETSPVSVEKIKLMQVFVNLLKNAKESLEQKSDGDKVITIDIKEDEENNCQMVEISDNGVGIAKENLDRIFQYGFTTRDGNKGFGLHMSALAMTELKGGLSALSDGEGLGATFTVSVPKERNIDDQ